MFNYQNLATSIIFNKMQKKFQHLKFLMDFQIHFQQPITEKLPNFEKLVLVFFTKEWRIFAK